MSDTMEVATKLRGLLDKHASPPAEIVSTLPKGGTTLDFVGHAEITRILIQEDPLWEWEPQAWDPAGGPLIVTRGKLLVLWGWMTVHGKRQPCVGTCEATKLEADKELIGDLLRNGAMRFGISLNLWSKAEKAEAGFQAPVPEDFYGWKSQKAHDEWWTVQSQRLKAMNEAARDIAIGHLNDADLFDGRKPRRGCPPFTEDHREEIEHIINGAEMAAVNASLGIEPGHSPHAIEVMTDALGLDDPVNHPEGGVTIEPWMWDLAEVEDLDAHKWETTLRAAKVKRVDALDRAFHIAERLGLPTPDGINDIHGPVAAELRVSLLKQEPPF